MTTIGPGTTDESTLTGDSIFNATAADTLLLDTGGTLTYNLTDNNTAHTNTIDADGHQTTLSGVISGTGALTFIDSTNSGTTILLSNVNTYVGATTIGNGNR